jgi:hypothetical protein
MCLAASAALINAGASLFGSALDTIAILNNPFAGQQDRFLAMAIAAAMATMGGLLVIHRARRTGWPLLLLAGAALSTAQTVPMLSGDVVRYLEHATVTVFAAMGAGGTLVVLGLLGAVNMLAHAGARGSAAAIAGVALGAPMIGTLALHLLPIVEDSDFTMLRNLYVLLSGIGIAGAIGATAMLGVLRRLPEPEPPRHAVTVVGVIAATALVVPALVIRVLWEPSSPAPPGSPLDGPIMGSLDELAVLHGMSGLVIFLGSVGLAAALGSRALGTALAVGLVLFAVPVPLLVARLVLESRVDLAVPAILGLAVAGVAAASRWRAWVAAGSCAAAGILTFALPVPPGDLPGNATASVVGTVLIPLVMIGVITAVATGAMAVAERTQVPVVLGAVATAIQVGLIYTGTLLVHGIDGIDGTGRPAGQEWTRIDDLVLASGIALLVGALLVAVLPFVHAPARPDQAGASPQLPVAR